MSPLIAHVAGLPLEELAAALSGLGLAAIATAVSTRARRLRASVAARLPGRDRAPVRPAAEAGHADGGDPGLK